MSSCTLLKTEQCFGKKQLDILKKRGTKAEITDFSVITGCMLLSKSNMFMNVDADNTFGNGTGEYYTQSSDKGKEDWVIIIDDDGGKNNYPGDFPGPGTRIALPFRKNSANGESIRAEDGILEVEYGYYPQQAASIEIQEALETAYNRKKLKKTGIKYTAFLYEDYFFTQQYEEFQLQGNTYIRVEANFFMDYDSVRLSNGAVYSRGDPIWVEVQPIKWLVDEREKIMLTDKIVSTGGPFNDDGYTEDFDETDMKKYLDEYFAPEILQQGRRSTRQQETRRKTRLEKLNPDETPEEARREETQSELIRGWIEAGESVLLLGPSGVGKTERIKTMFPNYINLKLTNDMFPEKVVGSVNLQTGDLIPPDFAKTLIMEAATEEERNRVKTTIDEIFAVADEIHERTKDSKEKVVILLDELLNVKPAIQGLVYTLVLERLVEMGRGLKLPGNVVLVGTGNPKKYSSVSQGLAVPLGKRFEHIKTIEPRVGEWLTEYAIPNKLHPSVIGYILYKYSMTGKSEDREDIKYFYEEVQDDRTEEKGNEEDKFKTNEPRQWTMISQILYRLEETIRAGKLKGIDVEAKLRAEIESRMQSEWAAEFIDFYNMPTLTPEEIVENEYSEVDLPRNTNERFAYMTTLLTADESQVEACREFIRKYCDPEYLAVYDIYWAGNDERRIEKIVEIQEKLSLHRGEEASEYEEEGIRAGEEIAKGYKKHLEEAKKETKGEGEKTDGRN